MISFYMSYPKPKFSSFLQEPTLQREPTVFAFLLERYVHVAGMLELERVSFSSVFSVPYRLQPKELCVFNQGMLF